MNLSNIDPEVVFKPKRRMLEYRFLNEQIIEIDGRKDLNGEEKRFMKDKLKEAYREYDEQFTEYHRLTREVKMWNALYNLNKKMNWKDKNN